MWEMLKSVLTGTPSTDKPLGVDDVFQELCTVELEIEQLREHITLMESELKNLDSYLSNLHVVYSDLKSKK